MSKQLKNTLTYSLIFMIMGYLLYSTFMSIDEDALNGMSRTQFVFSYWTKSNKIYLLISIFCAILAHIIRAMRWKTVLEPMGFNNITTFNATLAVLNGYFVNLFIPRGGEFSRPLSLKRTNDVPTDIGVGTVVSERIIDLLFLIICIGTVFIFQADMLYDFVLEAIENLKNSDDGSNKGISLTKIIFFGCIGVITLALVGIFVFKREIFTAIKNKGIEFLGGMWKGVLAIFEIEKRVIFILYSITIWVLYYLMLYAVFLAFPETSNISFMDGLTIFIVGSIAMAIPLPGGTGSYHKMVSYAIITLCFVDRSSAIAIVTLFHGLHTALLIILGGATVYFISKKTKYADEE